MRPCWPHRISSQQGLRPSAGRLAGSRSVWKSWPRPLLAARQCPSTPPRPRQFPALRTWPSRPPTREADAHRSEAVMLGNSPMSCQPIARRGLHGFNLPCCLPPPRRPWTGAAGCPELLWTFCALADRYPLHRPLQPPRCLLLPRVRCNQTRRPRPPRRDCPLDRRAVPLLPHRMPIPSSLPPTLYHRC
jgi:hypothetical protein